MAVVISSTGTVQAVVPLATSNTVVAPLSGIAGQLPLRHNQLVSRGADAAHPISAIDGLQALLTQMAEDIEAAAEAGSGGTSTLVLVGLHLTNVDLESPHPLAEFVPAGSMIELLAQDDPEENGTYEFPGPGGDGLLVRLDDDKQLWVGRDVDVAGSRAIATLLLYGPNILFLAGELTCFPDAEGGVALALTSPLVVEAVLSVNAVGEPVYSSELEPYSLVFGRSDDGSSALGVFVESGSPLTLPDLWFLGPIYGSVDGDYYVNGGDRRFHPLEVSSGSGSHVEDLWRLTDRVGLAAGVHVEKEVLADHETLVSAGLESYFDGSDGGYIKDLSGRLWNANFMAGDEGVLGRIGFVPVDEDGWKFDEAVVIQITDAADYLADGYLGSGGPIFDCGDGVGMLILHLEGNYYHKLGAARVVMDGDGPVSVTSIGDLWTHYVSEEDMQTAAEHTATIGSGSILEIDESWIYVYADTWYNTNGDFGYSVGRISKDDIRDAMNAATPTVPALYKLYEGSFTEPGLGGNADDLGLNSPRSNGSMLRLPDGRFVLARITHAHPVPTQLALSYSADGITWSEAEVVYEVTEGGLEWIYEVMWSGDVDDTRSVTSGEFKVLVMEADPNDRWNTNQVLQFTVRPAFPSHSKEIKENQTLVSLSSKLFRREPMDGALVDIGSVEPSFEELDESSDLDLTDGATIVFPDSGGGMFGAMAIAPSNAWGVRVNGLKVQGGQGDYTPDFLRVGVSLMSDTLVNGSVSIKGDGFPLWESIPSLPTVVTTAGEVDSTDLLLVAEREIEVFTVILPLNSDSTAPAVEIGSIEWLISEPPPFSFSHGESFVINGTTEPQELLVEPVALPVLSNGDVVHIEGSFVFKNESGDPAYAGLVFDTGVGNPIEIWTPTTSIPSSSDSLVGFFKCHVLIGDGSFRSVCNTTLQTVSDNDGTLSIRANGGSTDLSEASLMPVPVNLTSHSGVTLQLYSLAVWKS